MKTTLKILTFSLILGSVKALVACGGVFPGVFQIDITQGNIVSQQQIDSLVVGLEKQQVLYVLGTPLVKDVFKPDQWDYLYYFSAAGQAPRVYRATLQFEADRLVSVNTQGGEIKDWHLLKSDAQQID